MPVFRNFDEHGNPVARPNTLLIDSEQLEAGDALDENFRAMASDEIERFRREIIQRTGDAYAAASLSDQDLLREVMNTVGKPGQLGGSIRCVVSVSMLTEWWDANTVTHVLGVRGFGTQLLCEQVIGHALRRQSYELNKENLFNTEYAYSLCDVCARACEELAKTCDKHAKIDAFSRCAEPCRKCAEECAKLAKLKKAA